MSTKQQVSKWDEEEVKDFPNPAHGSALPDPNDPLYKSYRAALEEFFEKVYKSKKTSAQKETALSPVNLKRNYSR